MNIFFYISAVIKLYYAIHLANKAHEKDGQRYYVMPDAYNRLIIMNRDSFRYLKKKDLISSEAKVIDLTQESFYFTPYANGSGVLSPKGREAKRKMYLGYIASQKKRSS